MKPFENTLELPGPDAIEGKRAKPRKNIRVAVLGGGASGALVATQLLRRLGAGDEVVLVHRNSRPCLGVAYGTDDIRHRLNVRGLGMSAYPEKPSHFVDWLVDQEVGDCSQIGEAFISRRIYGEYLQAVLDEAEFESPARLKAVKDEAVGLVRDGSCLAVSLASGSSITVSHAVLAVGHLGPRIPRFLEPILDHSRFVLTPWSNELGSLDVTGQDVLIIGTGLTMVDAAISLGHRIGNGRIHARSRHGLMPHPHRLGPKAPVTQVDEPVHNVRLLAKQVIEQARAAGPNWRGVVDGCRSRTGVWWQELDWHQRARFLRMLMPFWEVHRHRIDDELYAVLNQMRIEEKFDVAAARVQAIEPNESGFHVSMRRSNGADETLQVGLIVNCTGPETNYENAKVPVLESVVAAGLATYDPLGMGLSIDVHHRTSPGGNVFAIGPLCRGSLWETTAIPEIRVQAELIARLCAGNE
jgi:uncharacterized NAD(P)/FAD-binding protein YdhS